MSPAQNNDALITAVQAAKREAKWASLTSLNRGYFGLFRALNRLAKALRLPSNATALDARGDMSALEQLSTALDALAARLDGMTNANEVDRMPRALPPGPLSEALGELLDALIERLGGVDIVSAVG
ncbi:hypothetical protein [Ktedonospora formicarum]|uniref:Uncharacterized protein n=1 Tax=Ktedonospora formicarum TaxID=2778364 RepID=A0A8J3HXS9_9CHLR|nr:hypothetical protein [Ktedonospora formicarum]GHO41944.1 hypothetical protein KSX_01070 [Ktedonospora formicarum]